MSIGVGKSQLENNGAGIPTPGLLAGNSAAAPSSTINLATLPGIIDWAIFCATDGTINGTFGAQLVWHWRKLGCQRLFQTIRFHGPTNFMILSATGALPLTAFSSTMQDDGQCDSGIGSPTYPLTGFKNAVRLFWSNNATIDDFWGFSLSVPANKATTILDIYIGVANIDCDVICDISDGSSPQLTVTVSDHTGAGAPLVWYRVSITFNAANEGQTLSINISARNTSNPSVASSLIALQAAVLHF